MNNVNKKVLNLVLSALIGAIYAALTLLGAGFAFGPVQFRFSEALCVMPFFIPGSAWGLAVGCAFANIFGGYGILDIVFGSLATLIAGLMAARIRVRLLVPLPAVLLNAVIVGAVIAYSIAGATAGFFGAWAWNMVTVGAGQIGACYGLGIPLLYALPKIAPVRKFLGGRA